MPNEAGAVLGALLVPPFVFLVTLAVLWEQHTREVSSAWYRLKRWWRHQRVVREGRAKLPL